MSPYTVYKCYDAMNVLIYVGFSSEEKRRIGDHRRTSKWFGDVTRIECEHFTDEDAALMREHDLIALHHPAFNKMTRKYRDGNRSDPSRRGDFSGHMSLKEAAEQLGVTRQNLANQAKRGRLHAILLDDRYVVTEDEFNRYRDEQAGRPGVKPKPKVDAE